MQSGGGRASAAPTPTARTKLLCVGTATVWDVHIDYSVLVYVGEKLNSESIVYLTVMGLLVKAYR